MSAHREVVLRIIRESLETAAVEMLKAGEPVRPAVALLRGGEPLVTLFFPSFDPESEEEKQFHFREFAFAAALYRADQLVLVIDAFFGTNADVRPREDPEAIEAITTNIVTRGAPPRLTIRPYHREDDGAIRFEGREDQLDPTGVLVETMQIAVEHPARDATDGAALGFVLGMVESTGWEAVQH